MDFGRDDDDYQGGPVRGKRIGERKVRRREKHPLSKDQTAFLSPGLRGTKLAIAGVFLYGLMIAMSILVPFAIPFVVMACIHTVFISSMIFLIMVAYGILTDLFAAFRHVEYYTHGNALYPHNRDGLINSDNPVANAFAYGIYLSGGKAASFMVPFAIVTFACDLAGVPFASFLLPVLCFSMLLVCVISVIYTHVETKGGKYDKLDDSGYIDLNSLNQSIDPHRTDYGYQFIAIIPAMVFIPYIVLRATKVATPALFVHFAASIYVQFALVALPLMLLIVGLLHLKYHCEERARLSSQNPFENINRRAFETNSPYGERPLYSSSGVRLADLGDRSDSGYDRIVGIPEIRGRRGPPPRPLDTGNQGNNVGSDSDLDKTRSFNSGP